jgi:hypothetical protein
MAVVAQPETAAGRELAKFEQHRTKYTSDDVPPGNPYQYRQFPQMLYKANYHPIEKRMVCMADPPQLIAFATQAEFQRAENYVEQFNRSCYRIVKSEDEERIAKNDGWRNSPKEALDECERSRRAVADIAANRHYSDQTMSESARAEAASADASTDDHLADIPAPARARGRKENAPMVTVPAMPAKE